MILEIHNFTQNEVDRQFFKRIIEQSLQEVDSKEKQVEISLAIVGNNRMRRLNKMYRGKNRVTDVLSFANLDKSAGRDILKFLHKAFGAKQKNTPTEFIQPPDDVVRLGEIVICYPQAKKQARQLGYSLSKEITTLLIHGVLHLLGYDHKSDEDEQKMQALATTILNKLSV